VLSAVFGILVLLGVAPFLVVLFGQADVDSVGYGLKPVSTGLSSESLLDFLKYELSRFMYIHGKEKALALVAAMVGLFYILKNLFAYLALYTFVPIKNGITRDIRKDVYNKLLTLPLSFFSKRQKGDLLTRATVDIQMIDKEILTQIEQVLLDFVMVVMMLIGLFFLNYQLAIFTFFLLLPVTLGIGFFSRKLKRSTTLMQQDLGQLIAQTEEALGGQKAIKGYQAEGYFWKNFNLKNISFYKLANTTARRVELASPMSEFLGTIAVVGILIFGGMLILGEHRSMSPEILVTFLIFLTQILNPAKHLSTAYFTLKKGKVSVRRFKMILRADEKITDKPNAIHKATFDKNIVFQNVSFHYESLDDGIGASLAPAHENGRPQGSSQQDINKIVINNISLSFEKNKSYAIVGPSGAGKTTIADLFARFYDCTEGAILIDGIDIRNMKINDVRALSAYVSQDTILFNDTIANNITFGQKNVSQDELIAATKAANAHEFIMETENGYNTVIGDSGMKLSGGQRQRLSIARAVLKHAPILVLDEATSALDTESEKLVQEAISELSKTHTTIAIAHRLSTIQHVDQIFVMDRGEIVETGTHAELLEKNGLYAKLCKMQTL
jgi:subfamily B ATP-binding cassette protein MsbA